jgi:hypothetical protein
MAAWRCTVREKVSLVLARIRLAQTSDNGEPKLYILQGFSDPIF